MKPTEDDERERLASHATLVRLANSCERAASREAGKSPHAEDLRARPKIELNDFSSL